MEIFNQLFNLKLTLLTLAQLGRHVENHFIGVNSGIMDQFAVIAGKKDHALMLQTQTLSYRYAPMFFENETLLIINTNKKRTLSDSKYNERYQECQEALSLIKSHYDKPIEYLCDLSLKEFEKVAPFLSPLLFKRVRHLVTENDRTVASHDALKSGDIYGFARYLNASHQSLKNDYEVTGIELDTLQDLLLKAGAIGARMTGAGFGGCVVALVPKKMKTKIKNEVTKKYKEIIGYEPTFYVVKPSDGTKKVA